MVELPDLLIQEFFPAQGTDLTYLESQNGEGTNGTIWFAGTESVAIGLGK